MTTRQSEAPNRDPLAKWKCSEACTCFKCKVLNGRPSREPDSQSHSMEADRIQSKQARIFSPEWMDVPRTGSPLHSHHRSRNGSHHWDISPNASARERLNADDKDELDALRQMKLKIDSAVMRAKSSAELEEVDELDEDDPANYTASSSVSSSLSFALVRSATNESMGSVTTTGNRSSTSSGFSIPRVGIKKAKTMPFNMDDVAEIPGFNERFKGNIERGSGTTTPATPWTPVSDPQTCLTRPTSNVSLFSLPNMASALHPVPDRQRSSTSSSGSVNGSVSLNRSTSVSRSSSRAMTLAEENALQAAKLASAHRECAHSSEQQVEQWRDQVLELRNEVRHLRNEGREMCKMVEKMKNEMKGLLAEAEKRAGEVENSTVEVKEIVLGARTSQRDGKASDAAPEGKSESAAAQDVEDSATWKIDRAKDAQCIEPSVENKEGGSKRTQVEVEEERAEENEPQLQVAIATAPPQEELQPGPLPRTPHNDEDHKEDAQTTREEINVPAISLRTTLWLLGLSIIATVSACWNQKLQGRQTRLES